APELLDRLARQSVQLAIPQHGGQWGRLERLALRNDPALPLDVPAIAHADLEALSPRARDRDLDARRLERVDRPSRPLQSLERIAVPADADARQTPRLRFDRRVF